MSRITTAFVVLALASLLPQMAFCEDVVATPSDEEIAAKDTATVKACVDFVDAKRSEADTARQQKEAKDEAAATASPDIAKGVQKTGPEAYLEAAAKNKPRFDYENCIGIVADACLETDDAQTTIGMMGCFGRESEVWDARLNASYREQTAASAKKVDDAEKAQNEAEVKHLRKVQTAWIAWRDATCEVIYLNGWPIYGSDAKVEGVYCDMVLTARQALTIEGKTIMSFDAPTGQ